MMQSQLMEMKELISLSSSSLNRCLSAVMVMLQSASEILATTMGEPVDFHEVELPNGLPISEYQLTKLSEAPVVASPATQGQEFSSAENTSQPCGEGGTPGNKVGRQCELCWTQFELPHHFVETTLSCGVVSRSLRTCQHCLETYLPAPI